MTDSNSHAASSHLLPFSIENNNIIYQNDFPIKPKTTRKRLSCEITPTDTGDNRVKRLTANDIIGHFLKHKELKDLEERIERIEKQLESR